MPTRVKGMTSLEIAIIVAIVLVIAVAVGWYLYTTFVAAGGAQPRLNVVSAEITARDRQLRLTVVNPGPVDVQVINAEVAGRTVELRCQGRGEGGAVINFENNVIPVGRDATCTGPVPNIELTPGAMLSGRVIVSGGHSFIFSATVRP